MCQKHAALRKGSFLSRKSNFGSFEPVRACLVQQAQSPEHDRKCRMETKGEDGARSWVARRDAPWCRTNALVPCANKQHSPIRCATEIRCQHPFGRADCSTTGSAIRA